MAFAGCDPFHGVYDADPFLRDDQELRYEVTIFDHGLAVKPLARRRMSALPACKRVPNM